MCHPGQLCFKAHNNSLHNTYTPYDTDFDTTLHSIPQPQPLAPHHLYNPTNDPNNLHLQPTTTTYNTISPLLCSLSDCPWLESGPHLQHEKIFNLNDTTCNSTSMEDSNVSDGYDVIGQQIVQSDLNGLSQSLSQPSNTNNFSDFVNGLQPTHSLPPTSTALSYNTKPELHNIDLPSHQQQQSPQALPSSYPRKFSTESSLDNHSTTNSYDSIDCSLNCSNPTESQYQDVESPYDVPVDIEQYQGNRCNNLNLDKSLYTPLQQHYRQQRRCHSKVASSNSSMDDNNQQISPLSSPGITITPKLSTRFSTSTSSTTTPSADSKYQPTRGKKMQYKLKDKARRKCIGDCVETIRSLLHISTLHRTDQASVLLIACDAIQQYQQDDKQMKSELKRSQSTIRELEAKLAKQELQLQQAESRCGLPAGHR